MKKNDVILLCVILALSLAALAVFAILLSDKGEQVIVSVDGEEYARLPLKEDTELLIETEYGVNTLTVKDGKAYISSADCPDLVCVRTGEATELKSIVCLPHRLTVSIEGGE